MPSVSNANTMPRYHRASLETPMAADSEGKNDPSANRYAISRPSALTKRAETLTGAVPIRTPVGRAWSMSHTSRSRPATRALERTRFFRFRRFGTMCAIAKPRNRS